jgi:hypothetical protein
MNLRHPRSIFLTGANIIREDTFSKILIAGIVRCDSSGGPLRGPAGGLDPDPWVFS